MKALLVVFCFFFFLGGGGGGGFSPRKIFISKSSLKKGCLSEEDVEYHFGLLKADVMGSHA